MGEPLKRLPKVETDPDPKPSTGVGEETAVSRAQISPIQAIILFGLLLAVLCVMGGLVFSLIANRDLQLGHQRAEQQALIQSTQSPTPSPTPTPTPAPSPTATSVPYPPTPTPTLVVPPDFINRDKIQEIANLVVNIRGLKPLQDVPSQFLTRPQLRRKLETEYNEATVSSALDRERELYIALGLLDPTTDFRALVLDSAAEGIAGFYTPDEQVLYLVAESVNMFASEEIVYAHEYTHALQDQHYGLNRFLSKSLNADQAIAVRALVEGDATLVMGAYQYSEITGSELEYMAYRASLVEREVIDAVSPSLGILTFFPYVEGSNFVYILWVDAGFRWDGVNAAYNDPPLSSEQIIHPEKYLVRDLPQTVALPDVGPALGEGWREIDRNVLGEIGLLAWMLDHLEWDAASEGAAGWDGDAYTLWMNEQGDHTFVFRSAWDAPGDAVQFFETYNDYLTRRALGVPQLTLNEPGRRVWEYKGQATFLARTDDQVLIILAPDRAILDRVRSIIPEF